MGTGCPGATAGDKPQPYIFLCGRCSWFPDCRFFRAAMVRGLSTHEGFLKPALRWSWPRRDRGRVARGPRLGTSPSPTFFSVGVVPGFPIAVFPRGYGSWITHPRRLSKAGPIVALASEGWGRAARGPRLGTSPSPTFFSVGVVPGFPIAVFPRGYGSWNTHPRRLSKAGPTVELASAGRRTMRLGPAAWEGPAAGDKPQRYMVVFGLPKTVARTMVVGVAGPCRDLIALNAVSGHGRVLASTRGIGNPRPA